MQCWPSYAGSHQVQYIIWQPLICCSGCTSLEQFTWLCARLYLRTHLLSVWCHLII